MADLRDLGLSDYEVRIYHGLLEQGQLTAQETAEEADVPDGRVYDVLDDLTQYGLVHPCETRQPKTYTPVEPPVALNRLLEAKQAQLETTRHQYETFVSEVADELDSVNPVQHPCETATVCLEETSHLLTDHLATATQEVLLTMATPTPEPLESVPDLCETLAAAGQNGADVSVLIHPDHALNERGYEQLPANNQEVLDIRAHNQVTTTVACLDREQLVMEGPAAFQQLPGFLLIDAGRSPVTDRFRTPFIRRWEQARIIPSAPSQAAE